MKLIHLSDLHIGKRVNEFSMIEDQKHILTQIIDIIDDEKPDGVMIAGDVYDKSVPSAEAVSLFDDFLCKLSQGGLQTFIISGNHDSPERLAFGSKIMSHKGIHISPVYNGTVIPIPLQDVYGTVNIWLLPFIKPVQVRSIFPDEPADSYTEAIATAISHMDINKAERNILVTHQFVTGATRSESEDVSVGGSDNVDAGVFSDFDYTALGHIHGPQNVGGSNIRYCGTPLKYSFSEAGHEKSVTVVELAQKGSLNIRTVPLVPLHDMREVRGTYMEVTNKSFYQGTATEDYIHMTLTDEEDIFDAVNKLRTIYPNIMKLDYDNKRTRNTTQTGRADHIESKTPHELFSEFYEMQNGQPMSSQQSDFIEELIENIWNGDKA